MRVRVVPGRYLEKLVARPGSAIVYGPVHYLLSALAVGVVFAVLVYFLLIFLDVIGNG